jgi:hypothetical protein
MPTIVITKPNSMFDQKPVARLGWSCNIGLLDRILATRFEGVKPIKKWMALPDDRYAI